MGRVGGSGSFMETEHRSLWSCGAVVLGVIIPNWVIGGCCLRDFLVLILQSR